MYSDPPSSSDSESHLLAENEDFPPNRNGRRAVVSWFWIANGIVLLANISVFLSLYTVRDRHLRRLSPDYSRRIRLELYARTELTRNTAIAGEVATKYEKLQLHGDFGFKSLYKGTPNPELDQAWEALGSGTWCTSCKFTRHLSNLSPSQEEWYESKKQISRD